MRTSNVPCWQCRKKLSMRRDGSLIYATVVIDGTAIRVHKICKEHAERALKLNAPVPPDEDPTIENGRSLPKHVEY